MILCIIPARYDSSRFPGKLLEKAGGKSILQRTYECALDSKRIDKLLIATDDARIQAHAESFGAEVVRTSRECSNGTARIAEAVQKQPSLAKASLIMNLQGDHPLTSCTTLDEIADLLLKDRTIEIATAARKVRSQEDFLSPNVVKCVFNEKREALYFSRSPIPYCRTGWQGYQHIGLYGYKTSFLLKIACMKDTDLQQSEDLEQLKFLELGYRIKVALVEDEALGIDTPEDLAKLEKLLCLSNISSLQEASFPLSEKD